MLSLTEVMVCMPEILVFGMVGLILIVASFSDDHQCRNTYYLTQLTLILAAVVVFNLYPRADVYAFAGHYVNDGMATVLKIAVFVISFFVLLYTYEYMRKCNWFKAEYFLLALFAVLGMMILISAHSLLTIYLGLELLSLSLYTMVAMRQELATATEAAMKYFILGALASGILLYGMSMVYGVAGSLDLTEIISIAAMHKNNVLLIFGLIFMLVGIAFKLGAVPFHMWIPDVYQGAPTPVTLFIASAPKLAAFAMAVRLLVDGLYPLLPHWQDMLIILSVLSMGAGNIIAISQLSIKRMLAYSAIAHIGYLLLGLLSGTVLGTASAIFYAIIYVTMSMGGFGMLILLGSKNFTADKLEHFKGLSKRSPWFAFIMLILMFSMAGVPPFLGFWGKWFVLKEVIGAGFTWLALVAVFFSVIGAYYYLRVIKLIYFDEAETMTAIGGSRSMRLALSANGLSLLVLGLMPMALLSVCVSVVVGG